MVPYVVTNGKNYIKCDAGNNIGVTKKVKEAKSFSDEIKARNYQEKLPRSFKNLDYHIAEIENKNEVQVDSEKVDEVKDFGQINLDELVLDISYLCGEMERFESFVLFITQQTKAIHSKLARVEEEVFDIEHAAEFYTLNARDGYFLYKRLHDARITRRKCKDALSAIEYISDVVSTGLKEKRATRRISGLNGREYAPRALPELFKGASASA